MLARVHKCSLNYHCFLLSLLSILHSITYKTEKRIKNKKNDRDLRVVTSNVQKDRCYFCLVRK